MIGDLLGHFLPAIRHALRDDVVTVTLRRVRTEDDIERVEIHSVSVPVPTLLEALCRTGDVGAAEIEIAGTPGVKYLLSLELTELLT